MQMPRHIAKGSTMRAVSFVGSVRHNCVLAHALWAVIVPRLLRELDKNWVVELRPDRARLQARCRRKVARVHAESDLTPGQIIGSMLSTAPAIHIFASFRAVLLLCVLSPGRDPRASPSQTCREFGCLRMKNYIETIVL